MLNFVAMNTSDTAGRQRPKVEPVHTGTQQQVFRGSGDGAVFMPEHYCTHEAVVVVTSGEVEIVYSENMERSRVMAGECHVIPANLRHTLTADAPFQLFLTIPGDAKLEFR